MELEKTGALIARARKERNLTQREVADALHVTVQAVSKWERGLSCPDVHLLEPLSETLGLTVSDLLSGKQQKEINFMKKEKLPALSVKIILKLLLASLVIAAFCYMFDISDREGILPIIHLAPFLFHFLCLLFGIAYSTRQSKEGAHNACHRFWRAALVLAILWFIFILLWTNDVELWRLAYRIFGHEDAWNDRTQKMTVGLFIQGFIRVRMIDYSYFSGLLLCFTSYMATEWFLDQKAAKKNGE